LVLSLGLASVSYPAQLEIGAKAWKLEDVLRGDTLTLDVPLRNRGDTPLSITKIELTTEALQAQVEAKTIPPQSTTVLHLSLDTSALDRKSRKFRHEVFLYTTEAAAPVRVIDVIVKLQERLREPRPRRGNEKPVTVHFFYKTTCVICLDLRRNFLPALRQYFGDLLILHEHDYLAPSELELLHTFADAYGVRGAKGPALAFVGNTALTNVEEIKLHLEEVIERNLVSPTPGPEIKWPKLRTWPPSTPSRVRQEFAALRVTGIMVAGLVDGLNPCAFATIVFFISLLGYFGRGGREMLFIGGVFLSVVFLTYFALGLGLFQALRVLELTRWLSRLIAYLTVTLVVGLAGFQVRDVVVYLRGGRTRDLKMQLPASLKQRIHAVMRRHLNGVNLALGAAVTAFLVTLLESVCTGQLYLPTLVTILREPGLRLRALFYLLLYNLMFVVPLAVVLGLAYGGVSSARLAEFSRRNLVAVKGTLAVVLLGIAGVLLTTVH